MTPESKSRVVYENLDTTFVNLWALLRSLSQRGFIGRVRVELKDYTADVFMTGSNTPLVHEIDRAAGTDTLEEGALHRLVLRARGAPGTISVFEADDETVAVPSTAGGTDAGVFDAPVIHAQDARATAETEAAVGVQSTLSGTGVPPVNHAQDARATAETEAAVGVQSTLSGTGVPPLNHAQDARATAEFEAAVGVQSTLSGTGVPPLNHVQDARATETEAASRSESETPALPSTAIAEPLVGDDTPMDEIEWSAVVKASGELVAGVERALTSVDADFASLFGAVRLELADDYTFLDPMSDGFTYANSVVTLTGDPPANSYVAGLSEALRRVVDRVATGDRARRVRERVALELFSVTRKRNEILARSGFRAQLDRIAGTKVV